VAIKESARAILAALILHDLGVPSIVARAQSATDVRILERVGGTRAVLVEEAMGRYVARALDIGGALEVLPVTDDVSIVVLRTPAELPAQDVSGFERDHAGVTVLALRRGDSVVALPGPPDRVQPGDQLVVIGREADLEALRTTVG
jgi:trk system potassium uptake protein TrkA